MIIQGTAEWFDARRGKVTASKVADVIGRTAAQLKAGAWGAGRKNYSAQLIAERLTGETAEGFAPTKAMQWGTDTEPEARTAYEFYSNSDILEVGFIDHPSIEMTGASPDGLVGDDGMVEIKCPNTATHIDTLLGRSVPKKYITQMQWQMACAERKWCDFVSYDPRMPAAMRMFVQRVERDDDLIKSLEDEVCEFLNELITTVRELMKIYSAERAA